MPAKSEKQLKFMYAAAEGKAKSKISPSVAKEFIDKTPRKKRSQLMKGKLT